MSFKRTTTINKILRLKKRVKAIKGSSSAGKTFGILPILIDRALKKKDLRISVVSENMPHLKKGAIRDFIKILKLTERWNAAQWNKTSSTYTFRNGSFIEFFSADIDGKVHGPRRDILYINECNRINFEVYKQLAKRTEIEIYLDWNPVNEFWFDDEIKNDDDVDFITVTYLDNEACPQSAKDEIIKSKKKAFYNTELPIDELFREENIKNSYWSNDYRVYGLGLQGHLQGTVFTNWHTGEFDITLPYCYGQDFGFNPDPTTLIKVGVDSKQRKIYLQEEFYKTDLSTDDIEKMDKDRIKNSDDIIIADGAEKREINELRKKNINITRAKKGADSIKAGIKLLQGYEMIVTPESTNLIKELSRYIWNDKKAGIPIDEWNHCIDPIRYAADFMIMRQGL